MSELLSIVTLYNYSDTLFSNMLFPEGFTEEQKETTINNILLECSPFEVLYPDVDFMRNMIGVWSKLNKPVWDRLYRLEKLEYNPIENYNRTEKTKVKDTRTETHSGTDKQESTGNNTQTNSGTDSHLTNQTNTGTDTETKYVTGYNSNTQQIQSKTDFTHGHAVNGGDSLTHGHIIADSGTGKSEMTHGEKITHGGALTTEGNISGNIGVTTSQQMAQQELDIAPLLNIMNYIVQSFKDRFCILVY